jgi:hypothetical protein
MHYQAGIKRHVFHPVKREPIIFQFTDEEMDDVVSLLSEIKP